MPVDWGVTFPCAGRVSRAALPSRLLSLPQALANALKQPVCIYSANLPEVTMGEEYPGEPLRRACGREPPLEKRRMSLAWTSCVGGSGEFS